MALINLPFRQWAEGTTDGVARNLLLGAPSSEGAVAVAIAGTVSAQTTDPWLKKQMASRASRLGHRQVCRLVTAAENRLGATERILGRLLNGPLNEQETVAHLGELLREAVGIGSFLVLGNEKTRRAGKEILTVAVRFLEVLTKRSRPA